MITLKQAENWLNQVLGDETRARSLVQVMRKEKLLGRKRESSVIVIMDHYANLLLAALYADGPTKFPAFHESLFALKIAELEYDNSDGTLYKSDIASTPDFHKEWMKDFRVYIDPNVPSPAEHCFGAELLMQTFGPNVRTFNDYDNIQLEVNGSALRASLELHENRFGYSQSGWHNHGTGSRRLKLNYDNGIEFSPEKRTLVTKLNGKAVNALMFLQDNDSVKP